MTLARFGNITVENGRGLELQVVAAVVVGGVNIFGGSGTVMGAMLGAIMIGTLEQSLFRLQISEFWRDALLGLLILLAVASDAVILQRLRALWARTEMKLIANAPPAAEGGEPEAVARCAGCALGGAAARPADRDRRAQRLRSPVYLGVGNIVNLFQLEIEKIIVALTMTSSSSTARSISRSPRSWAWRPVCWPIPSSMACRLPLAILAALAAGVLCGLINGFWVAYVGLPSLVVTLAGLIGYRGVARILLEDRSIGGYPDWFNAMGQQPQIGPLTARSSSS